MAASPRQLPPARAPAVSDAEVIEACLGGDESAWGELIGRYGRLVYSIPRRYRFADSDADDVFQSVFAILHQKMGTIRDRDRLAAWLIRTTHRECYRIGRRSESYADLDEMIADVGEPAQEQADRWERQHLVRQALRRLGGPCEELLSALFLSPEPSYDDVARRLGIKVGSIGPTRARCFAKLEKILREMGVEPGTGPEDRVSAAPHRPSGEWRSRGSS